MTTTNATAKPLNPIQQFYGTPTPSNAIKLALADSFAYCAPMQPDGEYVTQLRKALKRNDAYPKLIAELKRLCIEIPKQLGSNQPMTNALLRELGEVE
mgnify:CR=1 FL=1